MLRMLAMLQIGVAVIVAAATSIAAAEKPEVKVTVLYDNYVFDEACDPDWGFACLITGTEMTILFDTGGKGDLLLANFEKMAVRPTDVELIVISHNHRDHTGGLLPFLKRNRDVSVFLPAKTPEDLVRDAGELSAEATVVNEPTTICKGAVVLGPMGEIRLSNRRWLSTWRRGW
jgi:7,8-dihydropterin-6-yl-methyl-4-(beta-D-ribofuranosyl)aminobenzene 5'-phosphate synthase